MFRHHFINLYCIIAINFPKCTQAYTDEDGPILAKCIIEASEKARDFLRRGVPELGVPSIVGIVIPLISIEQKTRALKITATLTNITENGLDDYKLSYLKVSPRNLTYWAKLELPHIDLEGAFDIDGRVLDQDIKQKGYFKATLNDTAVDGKVFIKLLKRKGKEYASLKMFIDPTIGKAVGSFDGLFGDNQALSKSIILFRFIF